MRKLILIGNPVAQSLSPEMHNRAAAALGLPYTYEKRCVQPAELEEVVTELRDESFAGANVTIPYKTACIPFLDEVDENAAVIGAVNTIVKEGTKLVGYNTDGAGFVKGLEEISPYPISGSHVLVIGAGGAARGIIAALHDAGAEMITVCNRTEEKALLLAAEMNDKPIRAIAVSDAEERLGEWGFLVNTTSAGMFPHIEEMPIMLDTLKRNTVVADIIYNPFETKWLRSAKEKGAVTDNGISMFVNQGALAFEKWTGHMPDAALMKETVVTELRRKTC